MHYALTLTKEYILDGSKITSLEAFYDQVSERLIPSAYWGRNLDAFNDILRGGFGTPEGGFVLRWTHSEVSRRNLGHSETVRQLEKRLERCHPSNRKFVRAHLIRAQKRQGTTVFDCLSKSSKFMAQAVTRPKTMSNLFWSDVSSSSLE
ncbi:barnase inhibitor-like domain-containing protein [Rhizobium etli bv. phaseoli str. IE4803]|nr:barnase inhibitor-like domain-containing protein [Rhizobium etli bv. phaseoli str. IE4803]